MRSAPNGLYFFLSLVFALVSTNHSQESDIDQLLADLQSKNYSVREEATQKLSQVEPTQLSKLIAHLANSQLAEVKIRLRKVVSNILADVDYSELQEVLEMLEKLEHDDDEPTRELAQRFRTKLGSAETIGMAFRLKEIIQRGKGLRNETDQNPVVLEDAVVKEVVETPGFQLVQGSSNWPRGAPYYSDSSANPKILVYRVKWFRGGWSRWFVPGINDGDSKVKGDLMWRYFSDHAYEYVELQTELGPLSRRATFVAEESKTERDR